MSDPSPLPVTRSDLPDLYRFLLRYTKEHTRVLWEQRRLDGLFFHRSDAQPWVLDPATAARCRLWRDFRGTIVAAVFCEAPGVYTPHVLHAGRSIIADVMAWITDQDAQSVVIHDEDHRWAQRLLAAGYRPSDDVMLSLSCHLSDWLPRPAPLPERFRMRSMAKTPADAAQMANLLNAAFGRNFHSAAEYRAFQHSAPSYAQMLDLVVEDHQQRIVATVGMTLLGTGANSLGVIEPVATHPDARRLGCAHALLRVACLHAQRHGIETVVVGVSARNHAARRLYAALGCTVRAHERSWTRPSGGLE